MSNFKLAINLIIAITLTLGLSISTQSLLAAWVSPGDTPPDGNTGQPIFNDGGDPLLPIINRPLTINDDFYVTNDVLIDANLQVDGKITTSQTEAGDADEVIATKKYVDDNAGGGSMPMVTGWPDAIRCDVNLFGSITTNIFYLSTVAINDGYILYVKSDNAGDTDWQFNSAGNVTSTYTGVGTNNCSGLSIAQLEAAGRAFNFLSN